MSDQNLKTEHWIKVDVIRELSVLSTISSLAAVMAEWSIIVLAIIFHQFFSNPIIYFFVLLVIGSRMYALYSLMHDGMHGLLIKNKRLNDFYTRVFLAWPLFYSLSKSRSAHLAHHKYLKTEADPEMAHLAYGEFQFPMRQSVWIGILVKDILGINFLWYFFKKKINAVLNLKNASTGKKSDSAKEELILKIVYYGIILSAITYLGLIPDFALYWLLPYATIYQVLNRLRLATEHFNIDEENHFQTRSVHAGFVEKLLLFPHNLNYHIEHHLFPSVPFYRLPDLRMELMKNNLFKESAHINDGWIGVYHDVTATKQ